MKKLLFSGLLLLLLGSAWAQKPQDSAPTLTPEDSFAQTIDSATLMQLRMELAAARSTEAELKMEVERLKMPLVTDSAHRARAVRAIDSLRHVTAGAPVVVGSDTLFCLYTKRGGHTAIDRAAMDAEAIETLGKRLSLSPDSLYIEHSEIVSDLMYGSKVIVSLTDQDGLWAGMTRQELADSLRTRIVAKLHELHEIHGWLEVGKRAFFFVLVLVGQYLLFRLTNWLFRRVRRSIFRRRTRLRSILIHDYELLDTCRQVRLAIFASHLVRYAVLLLLLALTVPLLFSIFPATRTLAFQLLSYIWTPFQGILIGFVHYIPNLFTIVVIWLVIRYSVKGIRYLAEEIHTEKLKIHGFYADWAMPTFHIVRFLLYAFMLALIYPYLPQSESDIFKGISVFVGLIISLGSSTVVGNILAGLVITYMRPFKIGDRIRLNETTGKVVEKTAFVTRLRTPKNEVVTIPNSFIMSSHTVNYSSSAREHGLLLHTEITIGYDTPWRTVHRLLIEAAEATPGVIPHPEPFVLETSLSDYYPVYQLNACIRDADRMPRIYSDLHQNIQDKFAAAGVEIMSPAYTAYRNGNASTIPDPPEAPKPPKK